MAILFTYELVGPGWARAEIRHGDQAARLTASYLSDALGNLVGGVLAVLDGVPLVELVWDEEPGEYRWTFETLGDRTLLSIVSTSDIRREENWNADGWDPDLAEEDGPETVEFHAEIDPREFAAAVVTTARGLIAKDGMEGYLERWIDHPFPMSGVVAIEELLAAGS